MAKKYKEPLTVYAKRFGWPYQAVLRAKKRDWPLDDAASLLSLAETSPGKKLPLARLHKLVGEPPTDASGNPAVVLPPDHYSEAVFSLQPAYARLWTATDKAFKEFKSLPSPQARNLWTNFRKALTALMKATPEIDQKLRGLLEVDDVKRNADRTIVWMGTLMDSLERHALERKGFKPLAGAIKPLLRAELKQVLDKLKADLADPDPPKVSKNNPIRDLLAMASEERRLFVDYLSAKTPHEQRSRQSTYLHCIEQLRHLAKSAPSGLGGITYRAQVVEVRSMRACTELAGALRIMGNRLCTATIFSKSDPAEVALAFTDEVEQLFDRYARGLEPTCFGEVIAAPPDYVPYVSPPPYTGPSSGRDPKLAPYFAARDAMILRNGGKKGDTNPPRGFSRDQLKKLRALQSLTPAL